jgi:glycosidase
MKTDTLELMLTGGPFHGAAASSGRAGLTVIRTTVPENPGYAFVTATVKRDAAAGEYPITVTTPRGGATFKYTLSRRETSAPRHQGFGPEDVVYLIMPDRFANGDPGNDTIPGMADMVNREETYGRHGGDLKGIIDHLDYLRDLGVTAVWVNPLIENNNPFASYHGYAATDLYRIDARFGSNELYREFVREAHRRGLKVILDHVSNHISIRHPWLASLPEPTWLHGTAASHLPAFHQKSVLNDPHAVASDRKNVLEGWFVDGMPDLNQQNPRLARYLIQNAIWWVEYAGLDGIREDTYPYCDQGFLNRWCAALLREYPKLNIVGEVWMNEPPSTASFQRGNRLAPHRAPALPTVTDFPLYEAMKGTFARKRSINEVATSLAMDFIYTAPESLLIFGDNHDVPRLTYMSDGDLPRQRMLLTLLLTTRGIPQLLYGTELGIVGGEEHGELRADMPGGFPGDERNAFADSGRTDEEREWFGFVRELLTYRRGSEPLHHGRLVQYAPREEVYVYFRVAKKGTVCVVLNNSEEERSIRLESYRESIPAGYVLRESIGEHRGETVKDGLELEPLTARVFEVVRPNP